MNKEKKVLLKVDNAGFSKNNKWLVKDVSLEVKQGEIATLIFRDPALTPIDMALVVNTEYMRRFCGADAVYLANPLYS